MVVTFWTYAALRRVCPQFFKVSFDDKPCVEQENRRCKLQVKFCCDSAEFTLFFFPSQMLVQHKTPADVLALFLATISC